MIRGDGEHSDSFHDELIQSYLENEASATEEKQFRLLLGEESFRRRVAEYAIDLGHLYDQSRQGMLERTPTAQRESIPLERQRLVAVAVLAASVLLALGTAWFAFRGDNMAREAAQHEQPTDPPAAPPATEPADPPTSPSAKQRTDRAVIARVTDVTGQVVTADNLASKARRAVVAGTELHSGDMLRTVGSDSFALLKFDDDSGLFITGDTTLTCSIKDSQKQLDVLGGDIVAQVTTQPPGMPMMIKTPGAEAEVVGTRLSLFASLALTELAVLEGHVRLRRLSDDQTIDVKGGECAVASKASEFVAESISPVPSVWEEDFEAKWPARWRAGDWIHYALPPGSTGAAHAACPGEGGGPCFISTPNEWAHGLFRIADDTHLNLTYKLRWPGWFYIMLDTRTEDYSDAYRGNYMYQTPEIWKIPPNQWRTVSIPLRDFHEPQQQRPEGTLLAPPKLGDVVFSLFLRTQDSDPGLCIDRIWVTQGPDESAELLELP